MSLTDSQYLDIILGTSVYYKAFHAFAKRSLAEENLDFLQAAAAYRRNPSKKEAIGIIDQFVSGNAAQELNLDDAARAQLAGDRSGYIAARQNAKRMNFFKRHWTSGNRKAASELFDDAVKSIRLLIIQDTLPKFKRTPEGKTLIQFIDKQQAKNDQRMNALHSTGLM